MFPECKIDRSPTPTAKVRSGWRTGLVGLVLSLWLGWAGYLLWLGSQADQLPLDWHGLWDADSSPRLHPNLLGVQVLFEGASIEMAEGNRAFSLPPRGTVLLGKWFLPSMKNHATFAAWVKLEAAPPDRGLVAMAGITPPGEWGFGAWDGHPAAWFPKVTRPNTGMGRLVAPDPWRVGRWTHLAVVTSPKRVSFWLDGQRVASSSSEWAHPSWAEVALGRAPDFLSPPGSVPAEGFGLPPPPFLIDDFTVYARSLSDAEIRQTAKAGRGGLTRAQALLERQARIARPGTLWFAVSGLLLIGACVWRDASRRFLAGCSLLRDPAFIWVWVIVALGGGSTFWFTQRLAAAAQRADRERVDHFLTDLVSTGETHFERVADLLRRARDTLRQHPEMTHAEWHRWGHENGIPYDFSGLDGIGWAPKIGPEALTSVLTDLERSARRDLAAEWNVFATEGRWQLPVTAFMAGTSTPSESVGTMLGCDWLAVLDHLEDRDDRRRDTLSRHDVHSTGLIPLRPHLDELPARSGIHIYLPVYRTAAPWLDRREEELLGVVFAGVHVTSLVQDYWQRLPPLFGARIITGTRFTREAVVVDTGDLLPATRRPFQPYLTKDVPIRIYTRRLWIQLWTTASFHAHSQRYWPWISAGAGGGFTLLVAFILFLQIHARRAQEQINAALQLASARLRTAQQEREELSRDLHDGAIQSLYAVQLGLQRTAGEVHGLSSQSSRKLDETRSNLDAVIAELRDFILHNDADPAQPPSTDLCAALRTVAKRILSNAAVQVRIDCDPTSARSVEAATAVQFASIAREAISNSLRHADPREITIALRNDDGDVCMEIADDGCGFDLAHLTHLGDGLANMRARARQCAAVLDLRSSPGQGTRLIVRLPANPANSPVPAGADAAPPPPEQFV